MNGRIRAARDWVLWSPRRAIALLVGAGLVVSLVAAMTAGTVSARMAGATRPAPSPSAAVPTRDPGWLATGDPHRPSPPPAFSKRSVFRASSIPAVKNGQNSGINFP